MKTQLLLVSLIVTMLGHASASTADIAVIINHDNDIASLSKEDLKRIYTGSVSKFSNGMPIYLSDLKKKDPSRAEFYQKVTGKSAKKMIRHWRKKLFSGEGIPPKENKNAKRMMAWVSDLDGAIGYMDASLVDDSVRIILIIK